jgi:hypothetical protein
MIFRRVAFAVLWCRPTLPWRTLPPVVLTGGLSKYAAGQELAWPFLLCLSARSDCLSTECGGDSPLRTTHVAWALHSPASFGRNKMLPTKESWLPNGASPVYETLIPFLPGIMKGAMECQAPSHPWALTCFSCRQGSSSVSQYILHKSKVAKFLAVHLKLIGCPNLCYSPLTWQVYSSNISVKFNISETFILLPCSSYQFIRYSVLSHWRFKIQTSFNLSVFWKFSKTFRFLPHSCLGMGKVLTISCSWKVPPYTFSLF